MKIEGSSQISGIEYDASTKEMIVTFHSGQQYSYQPVTATQHTLLLNAKSIGSHFSEHIKNNKKIVAMRVDQGARSTRSLNKTLSEKLPLGPKHRKALNSSDVKDEDNQTIEQISSRFHELIRNHKI